MFIYLFIYLSIYLFIYLFIYILVFTTENTYQLILLLNVPYDLGRNHYQPFWLQWKPYMFPVH